MARFVTVRVTGIPKVVKRLGWSGKDTQQVAQALKEVGQKILDESDRTVPVKYGNLKATGKLKGPVSILFGQGARVTVEYGGQPAKGKAFPRPDVVPQGVDYAVMVHEVTARSGLLKWLQRAFANHVPQVKPTVQKAIDRLFASRR